MTLPAGFLFSGIHAGIKGFRKDLALIYSDSPCVAAGSLTVNAARAAPVQDLEGRLPSSDVRAVLINSGNANALTGEAGLEDVRTLRRALAEQMQIPPESVLTASTGVIGHRMPVQKIVESFPALVRGLRPHPETAAEAILTTDTRIKLSSRTVRIGKKAVQLTAMGKGSGMVAPEMATVLVMVVTTVAITAEALAAALRKAMSTTLNALIVDGDMSTNDCALVLANGRAQNPPIVEGGEGFDAFTAALTEVCQDLAREVAVDGEGASKLLTVQVKGVPTREMAQELARSVAGSTLVKAAVFGADPNWGRILAAVGARIGHHRWSLDPHQAAVHVQGIPVFDRGPTGVDLMALKARMREPDVQIEVDLRAGDANATSWGCDLSYDYVKINADYSALIVQTPDGAVSKDNRLTNYSPGFKTALLVEALSYISRFSGKRCVIVCSGTALVKESLMRSLCDDINLLRTVGLEPLVVHGGAPRVGATLTRMGASQKMASAASRDDVDPRLVEMVLSGSINSELVTLLNQHGGHAVGLSGKDGALLRARRREGSSPNAPGEITRVNKEFLEMLLQQKYIPVVSPIGIGEDGNSYHLDAQSVAAEIAVSIRAHKLIFLDDAPGLLRNGELVTDLVTSDLEVGSAQGELQGGSPTMIRALQGGVERVHVIDGRVPHFVIAELFTDRGVGTLVTP
jgi:acetylglutamate kinase